MSTWPERDAARIVGQDEIHHWGWYCGKKCGKKFKDGNDDAEDRKVRGICDYLRTDRRWLKS